MSEFNCKMKTKKNCTCERKRNKEKREINRPNVSEGSATQRPSAHSQLVRCAGARRRKASGRRGGEAGWLARHMIKRPAQWDGMGGIGRQITVNTKPTNTQTPRVGANAAESHSMRLQDKAKKN